MMDRVKALTARRSTIAASALVVLVVLTAAGYGVYQLVRPSQRGVLPFAPGAFVQGEFLVQLRPGAAAVAIGGATQIDSIPALGIARMSVPTGSSVGEMVSLYARDPSVAFAEPNYLGELDDAPNDPGYTNAAASAALRAIDVGGAWDITKGAGSVVVAVLDSGALLTHADLAGRFVSPMNIPAASSDVTDTKGHGTALAGIIGAVANNGVGVAGLCPLCRIMPVKVTAADGSVSAFSIASAESYAVQNGAKVISMSLGFTTDSRTLSTAMNDAFKKGIVLVAAAGNAGLAPVEFPAAYANVLGTGATAPDLTRATYSNYGAALKVMAPGNAVYSTTSGGGYASFSGTSFSTAIVAGVAAMIRSANPGLSPQQVMNAITSTARDLGAGGRDDTFGYGQVDACKAVAAAAGVPCGTVMTAPFGSAP